MAYVNVTLENAKHRKMRQKQNSDHNISQDRKDPECFVTTNAVRPDCLLFICPSRSGKIQPQLRCHGYNIALTPMINKMT